MIIFSLDDQRRETIAMIVRGAVELQCGATVQGVEVDPDALARASLLAAEAVQVLMNQRKQTPES